MIQFWGIVLNLLIVTMVWSQMSHTFLREMVLQTLQHCFGGAWSHIIIFMGKMSQNNDAITQKHTELLTIFTLKSHEKAPSKS